MRGEHGCDCYSLAGLAKAQKSLRAEQGSVLSRSKAGLQVAALDLAYSPGVCGKRDWQGQKPAEQHIIQHGWFLYLFL